MRLPHRRAAVSLLSILVATAVLAAQDPPAPVPFRSDVNYVRVDMYPTIRGQAVTDLQQSEIELLENGVPQTIDRFERVVVQGIRSQEVRREPATVAEMREAVQDVRSRVFVLFLDPRNVDSNTSVNVGKALSNALSRIVGGDDLIAVMRPGMEVRDLTFSRRTEGLDALLSQRWGERDLRTFSDPVEDEYATCYPGVPSEYTGVIPESDGKGIQDPRDPMSWVARDRFIAQEMILRRREVQALDALETLVRHLRTVREERKAVITISNGWILYRPNDMLAKVIAGQRRPPAAPLGVDPRTGKLGPVEPAGRQLATDRCEHDRLALSKIDNQQRFTSILNEANRANTSFYPVDPRGLTAFDENIVPAAGVGMGQKVDPNPTIDIQEDAARLRARNDSLRTMAEVTDGIAVVQTNQIDAALRRIADDLSSYYLIGYSSSEKLDGRFHRITVRIKRPGVNVRARRGYLAANAEALAAAAPAVVPPAEVAERRAITDALNALGAYTRERAVRLHGAAARTPAGATSIWATVEVPRTSPDGDDWSKGGRATATITGTGGRTLATKELTIEPGTYALRFVMEPAAALDPGDYQIQIRATASGAGIPASEVTRVTIPASPAAAGTQFSRRGPTTGNREMPTADLRFRRRERLIVHLPATSSNPIAARLLDRMGNPLTVPVTTASREEADGSRWHAAEVVLAPLAAGDYIVETTIGAERSLIAFRVLP
jgi:VWFA-related protein